MDPFESIKVTFFQECDELLTDLESGLLAIQGGDADPETVNACFRAVHSVKGGAGAFGMDALVRFAHVFETALDLVRSNQLAPDDHVLNVMLRATDLLTDFVAAAKTGGEVDRESSDALAAELVALATGGAPVSDAVDDDDGMGDLDFQPVQVGAGAFDEEGMGDDFDFQPVQVDAGPAAGAATGFLVRFRPHSALYAKANETALLLRELARLGPTEVSLDLCDLPELDQLEPEHAHLAWTVELTTAEPESAVREVFEFVDGDCDLDITPLGAAPVAEADFTPAAAPADAPAVDVAELIARTQAAAAAPVAVAPDPVVDVASLIARVQSEPAANAAAPAPAAAPAAPAKPKTQVEAAAQASKAEAQATIRVDLERVDRLIDLVGELVINQAMLAQRVVEAGLARSSAVVMGLDDLEQLTREIQDSVMAIRAQPVKSVFQRMPRLVREIAAMTGKQVRLVTDGEATEVDKTVIERLSDPLTHMIRNAVDHGLEDPAGRAAAGKPAEGVVRLSAAHRSGRVVIEVSDDGKGINRERVRAIAVEKGLIGLEQVLTEDETDNLIFMPGFSTAEAVSDISGRGVGMDVVKRSIQALGGRISITSRPGQGSVFTLSLPLTLAVLDGMVVTVGGHTLVVPLTAIIETLQPKAAEVRRLGPDGVVLAVRDAYVPLLDVGAVLGWRPQGVDPTTGVVLLVESEGGGRAALLVDAIQGQRQVVIKSLESNYQRVDGIAAATILGDGRVALILDVEAVIASRRSEPQPQRLAAAS